MSSNDTQLIPDCQAFLTPNADIAGIGVSPSLNLSDIQVRISVYFQTLLCILLLSLKHAESLFRQNFTNVVLTLYALAFALALSPVAGQPPISPQIYVVLHTFISILLLSSYALLCFHENLRSARHCIALVGAVPLGIYVFVKTVEGVNDNKCAQFEVVKVTDTRGFRVYLGFWAGSLATYLLTLPALTLVWFSEKLLWFQHNHVGRWLVILLWFTTWVLAIIAAEVSANTFSYNGPDSTHTKLSANEFAFAQVMAVAIIFAQ